MNWRKPTFVCFSLVLLLSFRANDAAPRNANTKTYSKAQIVVSARRVNGVIEYTVGKSHLRRADLGETLGEMRLTATADSEVAIILEDSMALSDIKEVPQMAIAAGFTKVRVFVYWKGTGNMAELFFGPVVKHNLDHPPD